MVKKDELELFEHLSRNAKLRVWLSEKLDTEVQFLIQNPDVDQLRRAQGRAGILQQMLRLLDESPAAVRK